MTVTEVADDWQVTALFIWPFRYRQTRNGSAESSVYYKGPVQFKATNSRSTRQTFSNIRAVYKRENLAMQ